MLPSLRPSPAAPPSVPCPAVGQLRPGARPRFNAAARALLAALGSDRALVVSAARALLRQLAAGRQRARCLVRPNGGASYRLYGVSRVDKGGLREARCRIERVARAPADEPRPPRRGALADALLYPVWLVDAAGEVVHENPAARGLRGGKQKAAAEANATPWPLAQVHPDERQALREAWGTAQAEQRPLEVACRFETGVDGKYRWQLARAQPQASRCGKCGWVLSLQDQHEAHTMREDLRSAACLRDNFLRVASHELSTPLTSLQLALQLALARVARVAPDPARRAPLAEPIGRALADTRRLVDLVSDLLDIKRLQAGKFFLRRCPMNLGELLQELFVRLEGPIRDAGCTLAFHQDAPTSGNWDAVRLQQVFFHLISNALKYAPGSCLHVRCGTSGGAAYVTVEDGGPGVPVGLRKKIFSLFERATEVRGTSGLGMGLYLCRRIVHAHHGNLRLVCRGSRGAKFVVILPRGEAQEADATDGAAPAHALPPPATTTRPLHG